MPAAAPSPLNLDLASSLTDESTRTISSGGISFGPAGAVNFGSTGAQSGIMYAALAAGIIALILVLRK